MGLFFFGTPSGSRSGKRGVRNKAVFIPLGIMPDGTKEILASLSCSQLHQCSATIGSNVAVPAGRAQIDPIPPGSEMV